MHLIDLCAPFPYCRVVAPDTGYAVPTLAYLRGPFWESFRAERWAKGLSKWERRNDCDNFARAYAQHAQDCHAISTGSQSEGLAVGEFFYTKSTGENHAIIAAFVENPPRLVFIEPQTGEELTLTEAEQHSAFFVRF